MKASGAGGRAHKAPTGDQQAAQGPPAVAEKGQQIGLVPRRGCLDGYIRNVIFSLLVPPNTIVNEVCERRARFYCGLGTLFVTKHND